jgi:hypothetical protein
MCKDDDLCEMLNYDRVGYDTLKETMLYLTYVIEEKIAEQMKQAKKGIIMHDGMFKIWSALCCFVGCIHCSG